MIDLATYLRRCVDLAPPVNPDRHEYRKVKPGGGFTAELDALYAAGWVFHEASNSGVTVKRERLVSRRRAP